MNEALFDCFTILITPIKEYNLIYFSNIWGPNKARHRIPDIYLCSKSPICWQVTISHKYTDPLGKQCRLMLQHCCRILDHMLSQLCCRSKIQLYTQCNCQNQRCYNNLNKKWNVTLRTLWSTCLTLGHFSPINLFMARACFFIQKAEYIIVCFIICSIVDTNF